MTPARIGATKTCPKCHELKPLAQYDDDPAKPDGLSTLCLECAISANGPASPSLEGAPMVRASGSSVNRNQIVDDSFGRTWTVSEVRPTKHGWPVLVGRAVDNVGRSGDMVIPTADLLNYAAAIPDAQVDLPLSLATVRRLRATAEGISRKIPGKSTTTVTDIFGEQWKVLQTLPSAHGFDVYLGVPYPQRRGGATIIATEGVMEYVQKTPPRDVSLPVGRGAVKRLRKLLDSPAVSRIKTGRAWWEARLDDLCELTLDDFAERHGVSVVAAFKWRKELVGLTLRPPGWWREGTARDLLISDAPRAEVAAKLGISVGSVGRLRWRLRDEEKNTPGLT